VYPPGREKEKTTVFSRPTLANLADKLHRKGEAGATGGSRRGAVFCERKGEIPSRLLSPKNKNKTGERKKEERENREEQGGEGREDQSKRRGKEAKLPSGRNDHWEKVESLHSARGRRGGKNHGAGKTWPVGKKRVPDGNVKKTTKKRSIH